MSDYPKARSEDLIIEEFDGELLVFDLKTATATCLNGWTARLWHLADGTRELAGLATEMAATEDMVAEGLAQLAGQGLLEGEDQAATFRRATAPELTRRQVMGRIGGAAKLATVAAPGVVAITVPRAVRAASGVCDFLLVPSPQAGPPLGTIDATCLGGSATTNQTVFSELSTAQCVSRTATFGQAGFVVVDGSRYCVP